MACDPLYTLLLVGLGIGELSAAPHTLGEVKEMIRSISMEEARRLAAHVAALDSAGDVAKFLRNRAKKFAPELRSWSEFSY